MIEDELLPLSALQHYLFCPRQCALIHVERSWSENGATAEGRLLHERVDAGRADRRRGVRTVRGLSLRSVALGLIGKADAVEFTDDGGRLKPFPIEYKRGRPKAHRADEVQLCAQALCLEEMFDVPVPEGALFYGQIRRRIAVAFDQELRTLTAAVARDVRRMVSSQQTPRPVETPACARCSLVDGCRPGNFAHPPSIPRWLAAQIGD